MARSLRSIESGIGNLTAAIARSLSLSGGFFDTSKMGIGTNSSGGLFGIGGLFSSTKTNTVYDQGLQFNPTTVSQIISQGISGATYQVIETIKHNSGLFGIGASTKTSYGTTTGALPDDIAQQFQLITKQVYDSVVQAAKVLGIDVAGALQQFQVEIGKISFKDMTGDEIQKQLEAVFSKLGDQMAGFAVAGLEQFQKAGEGLYETLMRIAKDYLTVDAALKSIGMTFGSVGASSIAARESLIELMGGLDQFTSQVNFFYDHFLTDAQKVAFEQTQVDAAFQQLGIAEPDTIAAFTSLVQGLDLTTAAGQATFAALMQIAPAFYDVATAADQLAKKQQELQVQLLQAQGNTEAATELERQIALAALDPSLQSLQKQVWAAQDAAAAAAAAQQLANKQTELQIQLLQAQGKAEAAVALQRKMELDQLDPALRDLQKQVWAAQDAAAKRAQHEQHLATAKDNLSQAYQRESQALQQTADTFRGFADDLKAFRDSLFQTANGTASYNQALITLMKQSGLAAGGDQTALGGGLRDAATTFMDIATQNAGSLQDVARARALVARQLDQAIGGAEVHASIAEQQLDQMKDQVGKLIDIDNAVLSVADAIKALNGLLGHHSSVAGGGNSGQSGNIGGQQAVFSRAHEKLLRSIDQRLSKIDTATRQGAIAGNRTARTLNRVTQNGSSITVSTDADTPVKVVS